MKDLDAFEAIVFAQAPAGKPWAPVTDYSFATRTQIEGEQPQRIKDVFAPERALDYGCGFGYLVALLRMLDVEARGYDTSLPPREQIPLVAREAVESTTPSGGKYDLVICREVLEHLTVLDLRQTVRTLCRLSTKFVYVTTRFAKAPQSLLDVDTSDDLDPTHITMLNQDFLRVLFVLEGFKRRADLEAMMDWKKLGRVLVYERAG